MSDNPFENHAEDYDHWFETELGSRLFELELAALRMVVPSEDLDWLEVGIGTGRFAQALGVRLGVDPSSQMASIARTRGIDVYVGTAENLPFADSSLDGVLMILSLCFVKDPQQALNECRRVLRPGGTLVVAIIPKDSRWGIFHTRRGQQGHTFYSSAHFFSSDEVSELIGSTGLTVTGRKTTELPSPIDSLQCTEESFSITTARR